MTSIVSAVSDASTEEQTENSTINWDNLSGMLSAEVFAALQSHLNSSSEVIALTESPVEDEGVESGEENTGVKPTLKNSVFKEQGYWDERFAEEEEYDWLLSYDQIQHHLIPLLEIENRILIVGCGNSSLSAGLYDSGFKNITNIDFSETVIDKMKALHEKERPLMKWVTMDMTDMNFESHSFDVIIDKASMDALMVDEGDLWSPKQSTIDITNKMCEGISRILRPFTTQNLNPCSITLTSTGSKFIQLSFAQPHFRTKYLMGQHLNTASDSNVSAYESCTGLSERYGWTLTYKTVDTEAGCLNSFLYVMQF